MPPQHYPKFGQPQSEVMGAPARIMMFSQDEPEGKTFTPDEVEELGPEWADSPAKIGMVSEPEPEPEPTTPNTVGTLTPADGQSASVVATGGSVAETTAVNNDAE